MHAADSRHHNPRLAAKLQSLFAMRGSPVIDLTLRPTFYELLRRLGQPHEKLPPIIHVAGTNGKGSTIAVMRACLEAAGAKVHVYTSPHLVRFNERIVLAGEMISDDALEALIDEVQAVNGDLLQTFFEFNTAIAFCAFARSSADALLLEVGMGGRLDATNVVTPAVTVITPIGLDHQHFLGPTAALIAGEKAGILKPGVPCITAPQDDAAIDAVFSGHAARLGSPLYRARHEWTARTQGEEFVFRFGEKIWRLPPPSLPGAHQIDNAGTALAALQLFGAVPMTEEAMANGLRAVQWPGRLQRLPDPAPGWELWLDGAHNEHGARALAAHFQHWQTTDGKPLHLIVGMLQKKDAAAILAPLRPYAASLTAVPIAGEPDSHTAATLPDLPFAADLAAAVRQASQNFPPGCIVIAGSLYLAGQALQTFLPPLSP